METVIYTDPSMQRNVLHIMEEDGMSTLCGREIQIGESLWTVPEEGMVIKNAINCNGCRRADEKRKAPPPEQGQQRRGMYMGHRLDR